MSGDSTSANAEIEAWVRANGLENKSLSRIKEFARAINRTPTSNEKIRLGAIDTWWKSVDARQTRLPVPKKSKAGAYKLTANPFTYMVDVMFMKPELAPHNKLKVDGKMHEISEILVFVDILSRYTFAYPIPNHQAEALIRVCDQFVQDSRSVEGIVGDDGFNKAPFKAFWERLKVKTEFVISKQDHFDGAGHRLGIIDNVVMQLRRVMTDAMQLNGNDEWLSVLPRVVQEHNEENDSRALKGRTPDELYNGADRLTLAFKAEGERQHNREVASKKMDVFKVGDTVRVRLTRGVFQKEQHKWSNDVYTVVGQTHYKYLLEDADGEEMTKHYDAEELLKVVAGSGAVRQPGADAPPAKQKRELRKLR
jgi:ribosomal protein L21E